jgi:hypothetical protein
LPISPAASASTTVGRRVSPIRAGSRLASLEAALSALGYMVAIELHEKPAA